MKIRSYHLSPKRLRSVRVSIDFTPLWWVRSSASALGTKPLFLATAHTHTNNTPLRLLECLRFNPYRRAVQNRKANKMGFLCCLLFRGANTSFDLREETIHGNGFKIWWFLKIWFRPIIVKWSVALRPCSLRGCRMDEAPKSKHVDSTPYPLIVPCARFGKL